MLRVIIVGAGTQGICLLRHLADVCDVTVLEEHADVGGVWHQQRDSPYASLQISKNHYRFPDYGPMPRSRAPAKEVQAYLADYVRHHGLRSHIRFNTKVSRISSDCTVYCTDGSVFKADAICCTGASSYANIPDTLKQDSERLVHTAHLTQDLLDGAKGKRCIVVGGSKSAAEAALHLHRVGAHVTWVARKHYSFFPFQDPFTMPWSTFLPCLWDRKHASFVDCLHPLTIGSDKTRRAGSVNSLDESEYADLKIIPTVQGEVKSAEQGVLTLEDGTQLSYDLIVAGTGYTYNVECPANAPGILTYDKLFPHVYLTFGIIGMWLQAAASREYILQQAWKPAGQLFPDFRESFAVKYRWKLLLFQVEYLFFFHRRQPRQLQHLSSTYVVSAALLILILIVLVLTVLTLTLSKVWRRGGAAQ